ncbi:MAG TPA: hypothetical protein VIL40_02260, partial [Thermaerobacter sp.]
LIDPAARITRWRGQWIHRDGIWYMPTYHPAALLRNPALKRDCWHDFKKVIDKYRELVDPTHVAPHHPPEAADEPAAGREPAGGAAPAPARPGAAGERGAQPGRTGAPPWAARGEGVAGLRQAAAAAEPAAAPQAAEAGRAGLGTQLTLFDPVPDGAGPVAAGDAGTHPQGRGGRERPAPGPAGGEGAAS